MAGKFAQGAPELLAEIALSSTSYDLHQKLELYLSAGVLEYLVVSLQLLAGGPASMSNRALSPAPSAETTLMSLSTV